MHVKINQFILWVSAYMVFFLKNCCFRNHQKECLRIYNDIFIQREGKIYTIATSTGENNSLQFPYPTNSTQYSITMEHAIEFAPNLKLEIVFCLQ